MCVYVLYVLYNVPYIGTFLSKAYMSCNFTENRKDSIIFYWVEHFILFFAKTKQQAVKHTLPEQG